MSYSLHRGAEADLLEAARFYRREGGAKLADRFLREFERVAELLVRFPELGTPVDDLRRHHPLETFPYSVIYDRARAISACSWFEVRFEIPNTVNRAAERLAANRCAAASCSFARRGGGRDDQRPAASLTRPRRRSFLRRRRAGRDGARDARLLSR